MAGRQRTTIVKEEIPEEEQAQQDDTPDGFLELDSILEKIGVESVKFRISKSTPSGDEFVYSCNASDFNEESLRGTWGGGHYIIRIYKNNRFIGKEDLRIATPVNGQVVAEGRQPGDANGPMLAMLTGLIQTFVKGMQQQQAEPKERTPVSELAEAMRAVHEINGGNRDSSKDNLDYLMRGIAMGQKMNGNGDWKSEMVGAVKDALPSLATMFPSNPQRVKQQITQAIESNPDDALKQALIYLKPKIAMGIDPETILEFVLANGTEPQYQQYIQMALEKSPEDIAAIDGQYAHDPYKSWIQRFTLGLREAFTEQNELEGDTGGESGNTSNLAANESISDPGNESSTHKSSGGKRQKKSVPA